MRNLKITLEYCGSNYAGWQTQSASYNTIQETLQKILHKILGEKVKVIGSGRTDAGVHALKQVANFYTQANISSQNLQAALNTYLPDDISIGKVEEVDLDFHSIREVKSKVYRYLILNRDYRSGLLKDRVYLCRFHLDLKLMRREARCLVGRHDFKAFCSAQSTAKTTVRAIKKISIRKISYQRLFGGSGKDTSLIAIDIEANGFLYNMVRSIVGTLIDVGRGRFSRGSLKKILISKDRKLAGTSVSACGLYLVEVKY